MTFTVVTVMNYTVIVLTFGTIMNCIITVIIDPSLFVVIARPAEIVLWM